MTGEARGHADPVGLALPAFAVDLDLALDLHARWCRRRETRR